MSSESELDINKKRAPADTRVVIVDDSDTSEDDEIDNRAKGPARPSAPKIISSRSDLLISSDESYRIQSRTHKVRKVKPQFRGWNRKLRQSPGLYFADLTRPLSGLCQGAGNFLMNSLGTVSINCIFIFEVKNQNRNYYFK